MQERVARATLGRLPDYLQYVRSIETETISATRIANALGLGEVQVRKDLAAVCGSGRPKIGYETAALIKDLEDMLGVRTCTGAVIVGAGKLGLALLGYKGFKEYGIEIKAAFDKESAKCGAGPDGLNIYPLDKCESFCRENGIKLAILTVPAAAAQEICDLIVGAGIKGILNFAPCKLKVPEDVTVRQENLALSLAHLNVVTGD
ncbi:MAG: redox-sensing transcriptional repressor Rex [Lachnospiraceae bacterium]|jgi:redox-sensing transcriptional repressor|nr:redox-sensing transcriptional repressor Rex [Lachnospiraceae bacterium]